jgi:hypothetical protein
MTMIGDRRIKLAPAPSGTDSYILYYWQKEQAVDQEKTATPILEDQPLLLYYRVAQHAFIWARDTESMMVNKAMADGLERDYRRHLLRKRLSGGEVRIRPDNRLYDGHRVGR